MTNIFQIGQNNNRLQEMKVLVTQLCLTLLQPHGLQPVRLLCPWDFPSKNAGMGCHFLSPRDLPDPRMELVSPALPGGFSTAKLPGKLS